MHVEGVRESEHFIVEPLIRNPSRSLEEEYAFDDDKFLEEEIVFEDDSFLKSSSEKMDSMNLKKSISTKNYDRIIEEVYRMPINKYDSEAEYEIFTNPIYDTIEWDEQVPNGIVNSDKAEERESFIKKCLIK